MRISLRLDNMFTAVGITFGATNFTLTKPLNYSFSDCNFNCLPACNKEMGDFFPDISLVTTRKWI